LTERSSFGSNVRNTYYCTAYAAYFGTIYILLHIHLTHLFIHYNWI